MIVDLRSDTLTKPSEGMRKAMAEAEVGDDVYREDPTVRLLEERAAELLGQEAAIFMTSGTQANLVAFLVQARAGETVILSEGAHPFRFEGGGLAAVGGLLARPIPDPSCKFTAAQAAQCVNYIDDPHFSRTSIIAIENTTNLGGGTYYSLSEVEALAELCRDNELKFHCDGARFFNATLAARVDPAEMGRHFDSICFCLSKGLGCPAGSLLAGGRAFVHEARRYRKMLGGGLRQVGVLAAAGLHALDNGHIEALLEDHRRAAAFRDALTGAGFEFPLPNPTNILYIAVENPLAAVGMLAGEGVLTLPHDTRHLRVVYHRDINDAGLDRAVEVFKQVLGK